MKQLLSCTLLTLMTVCFALDSQAAERRVNGLLLGAGAGAILGHAAGQDRQSLFIGSALGGAIGYTVGNTINISKKKSRPLTVSHNSSGHYRRHSRLSKPRYSPRSYRYVPERTYREGNIYQTRFGKCKETLTYTRKKGRYTQSIKTTCRQTVNPRWRNNHHRRPR